MVKVTVVGGAGGIGQPLSLLLKLNPAITELALADVVPIVAGVAVDLSHIDTPAKVTAYAGNDELKNALKGAQIVVIPAGVPRKPGMTRDDLFNVNAGIIKGVAEAVATSCPNAFVAIITNPVNSTVPIFVEAFKKAHGSVNPKLIFGVTTLDVLRANTFVAEAKGYDVKGVNVPVVGGHAGITIIPLLSQTTPTSKFTDEEAAQLTDKIQNAGTVVVEAKAGAGSATLSMAQAANRFVTSLTSALQGKEVTECAYVYDETYKDHGVTYFSSPIVIGKEGAIKSLGVGTLTSAEQKALENAFPELKATISKGVEFIAKL